MKPSQPLLLLFAIVTSVGLSTSLYASQINTGGENGSYHSQFCEPLASELEKSRFDYGCVTSDGAGENIRRAISNPTEVGFAQLDVFAYETLTRGNNDKLEIIRTDLGKECLFVVSKNKNLTNYGQVLGVPEQLKFILPPRTSGNARTFEFLQQIDPDGLGKITNISYANSTDEALNMILDSDETDTLTLFVQLPDPDNARFQLIAEKGGHFIPVIDRKLLRQEISGKKVYFAEETLISNPSWGTSGKKVVTACTPIVLFTGAPDRLAFGRDRDDQIDLIRTVRAVPAEKLRRQSGLVSTLVKQTKSLSATSVEAMVEATEKAKTAAEPVINKARDAAKPVIESASEAGRKAKESAKPMIEKLEQFGRDTLNQASEMTKRATESAKELINR